jgi:type VI secretion system protein ImpC
MSAELSAAQSAAPVAETSLLDRIVADSKVAKSAAEHSRARDLIGELVSQVMEGTVVVSENLSATLDARIAELDQLISDQLSAVMHAPEFQKLESSWRGLEYLSKQTSTGTTLKIKVFNTAKKDLIKDFKSAIDFDQSVLFKKVYEEEFGTFGGSPFGALIGDYEIGRHRKTCTSSTRCRTLLRLRMRLSYPVHRRSCSVSKHSRIWASRAISARFSIRSNMPNGNRSARAKTPAMSG